MRDKLYAYYQEYGYSPHGLVAISEQASGWEATRARGAVAYLTVGNTWLAAEPLAAAADLATVAQEFVEYAAGQQCFPVFLPVTERFARAGVGIGLDCVALGKSPYFDLRTWKCEGRKLYTVRKELKKAARAGLIVSCVPGAELPGEEARHLQKVWIGALRSPGFSWIFSADTFNFASYKKHFLARDESGRLVGLLSAAPLPARNSYYFKDLNRHPEAPKGTSDLLITGAMAHLREQRVHSVTQGSVPLIGIRDPEALSAGNYPLLLRLMRFLETRCEGLYGVTGLKTFKSRFAPTWWEHEYALAPRGFLGVFRAGMAAGRATAPQGFLPVLLRGFCRG